MSNRKTFSKTFRILFVFPFLFSALAFGNPPYENAFPYQPLVDRLVTDGIDSEFLSVLFTDPRSDPVPDFMTISLGSREVPELYTQFLTPESIQLARNFLRDNLMTLRKMEKRFHVDKEIAVAILLVESRFGENIGKHRVIPTLASIALTGSKDNVQENYLRLREMDPDLSFEQIETIAKRKATWAYRELKCFLHIVSREKIDPLEIRGSYAGALGMAQFIPSSYLGYAQSKESLEHWLLSKEEAIFSIGNYLKSHGWKKNLTDEKKRQLLWTYNRSTPYIETILEIAKRIKD